MYRAFPRMLSKIAVIMGETISPSVAHVGYDISKLLRAKLSWVEKYRNPRATEG